MDTEKINTVPIIGIFMAVFFVEAGAAHLPASPLITTAAARCGEVAMILMILYLFDNGVSAIGLSRDRLRPGFYRGLVWSAGFGTVAALAGWVLFFSGIQPLQLIHVNLPENSWEKILFFGVGGILAPVAEEIFFRGVIYGYVKAALNGLLPNRHYGAIFGALIISTTAFVAAHTGISGIPLPQLVGGIVFCLSYEREKSLMTPIVIHSLGNLALFSLSLPPR